MEAMKGSVTSKDLNLLSEQLGKDAVTRVHRLQMFTNKKKEMCIGALVISDSWLQA